MGELKQALTQRSYFLRNILIDRGWRDLYRDLKDFACPDRGRYLDSDQDTQQTNHISRWDRRYLIDDTLEKDLLDLAAGLQEFGTPKKSVWFKPNLSDDTANTEKENRQWLDTVALRMQALMAQSNFYEEEYNALVEMCTFGTGCFMIEDDDEEGIFITAFTAGEYVLASNGRTVDTFMRQTHMTVRQLVAAFGIDEVSSQVRRQFKKGSLEILHLVYHLIEPIGLLPIELPDELGFNYVSVYWESGGKPLSVGGYDIFPVVTPRWNSISIDTFGKESPGQRQLNNSKELQARRSDSMEASEKAVKPPLWGNIDPTQLDTDPNGYTKSIGMDGGPAFLKPIHENPSSQADAFASVEFVRNEIHEGTYKDQFLVVQQSAGDRKTATEITALQSEKLTVLSPIVNRLDTELAKPALNIIYHIMKKQERFPEAPEAIEDAMFEFEFTSVLAQVGRSVINNAIDRFVGRVAQLASAFPEAAIAIDPIATVFEYAGNDPIPAAILHSRDEIAQILQQQAEEAARQKQMEMAAASAQNSKDLGSASTEPGTALGDLVQ